MPKAKTKYSYDITAFNSIKLNLGNYEQESPGVSCKMYLETGEPIDPLSIRTHIDFLQSEVNSQVEDERQRIKFPKSPLENHRIRVKGGKEYPSSTTIITPITPSIPNIELEARAGTLLDTAMKDYIDDGMFTFPDFEECPEDEFVVNKFTDVYKAMNKRLPLLGVEFSGHSLEVYNETFMYSGELDAVGTYNGKKAVFDFKKTKTISKDLKEKYFMQMASYAECLPDKIEVLVIVSPFNDLIITDDINLYIKKFLVKRGEYKAIYGK